MDAITIKDLTFRYRKGKDYALKNISLTIKKGEFVVIMGHTGAGKSTLCATFNGLIPQLMNGDFQGDVVTSGMNTREHKVKLYAPHIGLVFQDFEAQLFSTSVELEVAFGPENLRIPKDEIRQRIEAALVFTGLKGYEKREPATLSGGEKQRLAIASVLAMHPHILCLDEPTTDLDPIGKEEVFSIASGLKSDKEVTMIIVEHETEEALLSDRIILMGKGEVIDSGPPREILKKARLLEETGIMPLQVAALFERLDMKESPLTLSEAEKALKESRWTLSQERCNEIRERDKEREKRYGGSIIKVEGLSYTYGNGQPALKGIDLAIREGEFVAIVGQNGSGKTTLVKHLKGLLYPKEGRVIVDGIGAKEEEIDSLSRIIGYVFQNPDHQIFAERVYDEVAFGPRLQGLSSREIAERVDEALHAVGLLEEKDADPFTLTKGGRQKIAVASILSTKPKIIILDEPTTGLDYQELRNMMELLRRLNESGHTIIMVTHSMWVVAEYAHRIIIMKDGQVSGDGPARWVFSKEERLKESHLKPPQIVTLGNKLGFTTLSVEELSTCLKQERA